MSKIQNKRYSLEKFIREQTLGPGINGYRFIDMEDDSLTIKNLSLEKPINYLTEILDIVPADIYSTGIFFPDEIKSTGISSCEKNIINNEIVSNDDNGNP